jgi:GNAT superfamily N-acetyltransferase
VPPHVLGRSQLAAFANAIAHGEEVQRDGLQARILQAAWLAIVSIDGKPVGCGALKLPTENHREDLTELSGIDVSEDAIKYELGWIVIDPRARGQKLSRLIVSALLEKAGDAGVFCTVRGDNLAIQTACRGYGFVERGKRWEGSRGPLALGVWEPPNTDQMELDI